MNWMELLSVVLYTIISVVLPIVAKYLVDFLRAKRDARLEDIENEQTRQGISEATDAVFTAVTATAQTYVDGLKKDGMFDANAQKEAFRRAYSLAYSLMTEAASKALKRLYGGVNEWLEAKIEQSVRVTKESVISSENNG